MSKKKLSKKQKIELLKIAIAMPMLIGFYVWLFTYPFM